MKKIIGLSIALGFVFLFCGFSTASATNRIKVVATLSTFADLARTIGRDYVDVSYIASPRFNPHFIEPKPSDVLKVKRADLFLHAGLDLELWRWPLVDAAGNRDIMAGGLRELDLSRGIELLEVPERPVSRAEGDIHIYGNPHYWMDPSNAKKMAEAISDKLCAIDPENEANYRQNLKDFLSRLEQKMAEWRLKLASYKGQEIVGYHNEWPYLMRFAGLNMGQFLEPKPGIPPTPKQIEFIQQYVKDRGIRGIVQSTYFPTQASDAIARRTNAKIILLCQNVAEVKEAADYIAMIEYNITKLVEGLKR